MNLGEGRNYQRLMETLDAMELSECNRRLAEQYLDMTQPEDQRLLAGTEHQDFSRLDKNQAEKCKAYEEYLKKRNRTGELERYVRFAAAVGGSTALYVLVIYGWLETVQNYLTKEQVTAICAESIVWNNYFLPRVLEQIKIKDVKILRSAMELCYHKSDNAKVLLAALSLYYTKPQGNSWKGLFSKREQEKEIQDTVHYLEENLIASIPNLFTAGTPSQADMEKIQSFVRESAADAVFPYELSVILRGAQISEYLTMLLSGAAFLAIDHSDRFRAFLRLTAAMDTVVKRSTTLDTCLNIGGKDWFLSHIETLEERLPMPREAFVRWSLQHREDSILTRAIKRDSAVIRHVILEVSSEDSLYLMSRIKTVSPRLYQDLKAFCGEEVRIKIAEELTKNFKPAERKPGSICWEKQNWMCCIRLYRNGRQDGIMITAAVTESMI